MFKESKPALVSKKNANFFVGRSPHGKTGVKGTVWVCETRTGKVKRVPKEKKIPGGCVRGRTAKPRPPKGETGAHFPQNSSCEAMDNDSCKKIGKRFGICSRRLVQLNQRRLGKKLTVCSRLHAGTVVMLSESV